MNNIVVLDIDNTIAAFEPAFCTKFGWNNRHMTMLESRYPKDADLIGAFASTSPAYERLDIVETGYRIAKWCRYMDFEIHLVSARPYYLQQTTVHWLSRNKVPYDHLSVALGRKADRIKYINPLFIVDDILRVCLDCAEMGIPGFLIDWPWNQGKLPKKVKRIRNFAEFQEEIKELMNI